jgi:hypothetical protein
MKALFLAALLACTAALASAQIATNYHCNRLSPRIKSAMSRDIVFSNSGQLVVVEGQSSHGYSSVRHESDYFVIPADNPDGARILMLPPFTTSNDRPWFGIEETNIFLTDYFSGEVFSAPLTVYEDLIGAKTHHATLSIDGRDVYVFVYYAITPRYPATIITWGRSATFGSAGAEIDNLSCPVTEPEVIPTNSVTKAELMKYLRVKGRGKTYAYDLTLARPLHARHRIESSHDGKHWEPLERSELLLNDSLNQVIVRTYFPRSQFRIVIP